ncbi:uncharacterized protein LOC101854010 [Aplysia californica]|uniref:Uncharacterized protein LOC101854010 n=1 Tax=Aplysia californica TaxID=6500 RepID=A0ABM0JKL5_APLCA|nr:uncharacterized protein LOC101854010 [Aplysia californica]
MTSLSESGPGSNRQFFKPIPDSRDIYIASRIVRSACADLTTSPPCDVWETRPKVIQIKTEREDFSREVSLSEKRTRSMRSSPGVGMAPGELHAEPSSVRERNPVFESGDRNTSPAFRDRVGSVPETTAKSDFEGDDDEKSKVDLTRPAESSEGKIDILPSSDNDAGRSVTKDMFSDTHEAFLSRTIAGKKHTDVNTSGRESGGNNSLDVREIRRDHEDCTRREELSSGRSGKSPLLSSATSRLPEGMDEDPAVIVSESVRNRLDRADGPSSVPPSGRSTPQYSRPISRPHSVSSNLTNCLGHLSLSERPRSAESFFTGQNEASREVIMASPAIPGPKSNELVVSEVKFEPKDYNEMPLLHDKHQSVRTDCDAKSSRISTTSIPDGHCVKEFIPLQTPSGQVLDMTTLEASRDHDRLWHQHTTQEFSLLADFPEQEDRLNGSIRCSDSPPVHHPTRPAESWSAEVVDHSGMFGPGISDNCVVCGEVANGNFFGAVVCLPCKSFFIRCTKDGEPCILQQCGGNCDIKKQLRNRCQYCRYQQCLAMGMTRKEKPESIMPQEGQELCKVCGDLANGIHFGVYTCEGCKKFFRRGLKEHLSYVCKDAKRCRLNPRNRNNCRYCRYQKCLLVGMSREAIKMGRPRKLYPNRNAMESMSGTDPSGRSSYCPMTSDEVKDPFSQSRYTDLAPRTKVFSQGYTNDDDVHFWADSSASRDLDIIEMNERLPGHMVSSQGPVSLSGQGGSGAKLRDGSFVEECRSVLHSGVGREEGRHAHGGLVNGRLAESNRSYTSSSTSEPVNYDRHSPEYPSYYRSLPLQTGKAVPLPYVEKPQDPRFTSFPAPPHRDAAREIPRSVHGASSHMYPIVKRPEEIFSGTDDRNSTEFSHHAARQGDYMPATEGGRGVHQGHPKEIYSVHPRQILYRQLNSSRNNNFSGQTERLSAHDRPPGHMTRRDMPPLVKLSPTSGEQILPCSSSRAETETNTVQDDVRYFRPSQSHVSSSQTANGMVSSPSAGPSRKHSSRNGNVWGTPSDPKKMKYEALDLTVSSKPCDLSVSKSASPYEHDQSQINDRRLQYHVDDESNYPKRKGETFYERREESQQKPHHPTCKVRRLNSNSMTEQNENGRHFSMEPRKDSSPRSPPALLQTRGYVYVGSGPPPHTNASSRSEFVKRNKTRVTPFENSLTRGLYDANLTLPRAMDLAQQVVSQVRKANSSSTSSSSSSFSYVDNRASITSPFHSRNVQPSRKELLSTNAVAARGSVSKATAISGEARDPMSFSRSPYPSPDSAAPLKYTASEAAYPAIKQEAETPPPCDDFSPSPFSAVGASQSISKMNPSPKYVAQRAIASSQPRTPSLPPVSSPGSFMSDSSRPASSSSSLAILEGTRTLQTSSSEVRLLTPGSDLDSDNVPSSSGVSRLAMASKGGNNAGAEPSLRSQSSASVGSSESSSSSSQRSFDPYTNEQTLVYINEMFLVVDTLTDSSCSPSGRPARSKSSTELDALDSMFTNVYGYSPAKVTQFWKNLYSYMPRIDPERWCSILTPGQLDWLNDITHSYVAQVEACDEDTNPPSVNTNQMEIWPPRGEDTNHWKHFQERVARQTYAEAQFVLKLPGMDKIHPKDRVKLGNNTRLFGNTILMASREWFDPVRKKFKFFWNWKLPQEHPLSAFRSRIVKTGSRIFNLHMDRTEVALLSALNIMSPENSTFQNLPQITEHTQTLMKVLCYYLSTINVDPDDRIPELLSVMPKVRHMSMWYSNLIRNMRADPSSMDKTLQDLTQMAAKVSAGTRQADRNGCRQKKALPELEET